MLLLLFICQGSLAVHELGQQLFTSPTSSPHVQPNSLFTRPPPPPLSSKTSSISSNECSPTLSLHSHHDYQHLLSLFKKHLSLMNRPFGRLVFTGQFTLLKGSTRGTLYQFNMTGDEGKLLGRGSQGTVFKAIEFPSKRLVALKLLLSTTSSDATTFSSTTTTTTFSSFSPSSNLEEECTKKMGQLSAPAIREFTFTGPTWLPIRLVPCSRTLAQELQDPN